MPVGPSAKSEGRSGTSTGSYGGYGGYSPQAVPQQKPTQMSMQLSSLLGGGGGGQTQFALPGSPAYTQQVTGGGNTSKAPGFLNSGGGGGSPAVTYNPEPFSVSSQENPQLASLIGEMGSYRSQMAAGNDLEATQALQRQRDMTSGMAKEFGENAAQRGIYGSGASSQALQNQVLEPAQREMGQLNANLASDARAKQMASMGQQAGAIGQQAGITQAQQNFGLNAYQARQQAQLGAAQLEAMQRNNNTNNAMQLMSLLGNLYTGF